MIPENFPEMVASGRMRVKTAAFEFGVSISAISRAANRAGVPFKMARRQAILSAIQDGDVTSRSLADRFGTSLKTMCVTLRHMEIDGFIERHGLVPNKGKPKFVRWRVARTAP